MVPRCAELRDIVGVSSRLARCERAFGQTINTISAWSVVLSDSVPMDGGAIILRT